MTRFLILGPIEVSGPAAAVDVGGPKQRALLGRLVLDANRVVSVDQLAAAVWDDSPPPSAHGSLQVLVSKLRKVLRDDEHATSPIGRRGNGYVIEVDPAATDIGAFVAGCAATQGAVDAADWPGAVTAAESALRLWRGPLLGEFADREWVRVAAATVDEQRTSCELNLVRGLLGCDRVDEAITRCRSVDDDQPLRENAAWLHAVALHRGGRSPDALEVLRRHGRQLADELGLDTGPAIRDLQAGILRQDAALQHWPRQNSPRVLVPSPVPPVVEPEASAPDMATAPATDQPAGSDDFVGRGPELALAAHTLTAADRGAAWLVLTGEAGIGKTTLADQIARQSPARTVRCSCPDDDGVPLWWPMRQLLDALGLDSAAALAAPSDVDADSARYAVYDAVSRALTTAVGDEPCLVLVEDVHWADAATLQLLNHLAGLAPGRLPGLAIVLTARPAEGSPEVARLMSTVARRAGSRTIALPPLTASEVAELSASISGAPVEWDNAIRLAMRTGGNPFFVCEYARLPRAERERGDVPAVVSAVLERRIGVLNADVLQALRSAAVIGDVLDIDLLRRVSRLDLDELADLLDEAADERIIVAGPGGYAFSHALVREQLLVGLSGLRRQRLHLRVADVVAGDGLAALVRRASHLVAAGGLAEPADVFAACQAAALESDRRLEPESAARWWGHAIDALDHLPEDTADRDELVVSQLAALARSGRGQTVLEVIDAALLDALRRDRMDSIARIAGTLNRTSGSWPWAAYGSDPAPLLARLTGLEPLVREHPYAHVRVLAALAVGNCYCPDPAVPDELSRRAIALAERLDDIDALADALLGRALTFSGVAIRARESLELLTRFKELGRPAGLDDAIAHGLSYLAHMCLGEVDAAAEHVRQGSALSDLLRLSTSRVQFRWAETSLRYARTDDLAEIESLLDHAVDLHRQTELYESGTFDIALFTLRWEQGRLTREEFGDASPRNMPWAASLIAVAERDPAAHDLLSAEIARKTPPLWITHYRLTMLAHAVADLGALDLVDTLLSELEPMTALVANAGQVSVAGPVGYAVARLHTLAGDHAAASATLDVATDVACAAGAPRWLRACRALSEQLASVPQSR